MRHVMSLKKPPDSFWQRLPLKRDIRVNPVFSYTFVPDYFGQFVKLFS